MAVRATAKKPDVPLLWIDTSVVIDLVRIGQGKGDPRVEALVEVVKRNQEEQKLLCLDTGQRHEFDGHAKAKRIQRELDRLTYGLRALPRSAYQRRETLNAMECYIAGVEEWQVPLRAYSDQDPRTVLEEVAKRNYFLVTESTTPEDILQRAKTAKGRTHHDLERVRTENRERGRSFAEQLTIERRCLIDLEALYLDRARQELASAQPDYLFLGAGRPLSPYRRAWRYLEQPDDELERFLISDHMWASPSWNITSQLFADLLTSERTIQAGDAADVDHMSVAIPTCRWVLTDRSLEYRVQQLGLDDLHDTHVCSLKTIDELILQLEQL